LEVVFLFEITAFFIYFAEKTMNKNYALVDIQEVKKYFHNENKIDDFFYYQTMNSIPVFNSLPSRINGFTFGICLEGWIDISIGLQRFRVEKGGFMVILPVHIFQVNEQSADFDARSIMISTDFVENLNTYSGKMILPYPYIEENPITQIDMPEGNQLLIDYYTILNKLQKFSSINLYYKEMIQHLVYAFLLGIASIYEQFVVQLGNSNDLFKRFLLLLNNHFKTEHSVVFYADKLCLTPKYFSAQIKKQSGKTVGEWIDDMIILEAKVLLKTPNTSVQQVADILNFCDQSTFGKFFKRCAGISPKEYRNS
jgi:AraC-like DNA-binding protein